MRGFYLAAATGAVAISAASAQNPFKPPKANLKAEVNYELSGDSKGTALTAFDGDRYVSREEGTTKMLGKETKTNSWTMITADSMYSADLEKKKGTQAPNMLPLMAKAYDDLDGASKTRLHTNMKDMAGMMQKAFSLDNLNLEGEKLGEKTIAGELCEDRQVGPFSVCSMKKAPRLALETKGEIVCFSFNRTATSVKLGPPSAAAFEKPAGVVFTMDPELNQHADSMARGMIGYLASQQLADSIAKAKSELAAAQTKAQAEGKPAELTKEQKEQMKAACEMVKNFDLGKVMANAGNQMLKGLGNAALESGKQAGMNKLKGLLKKPKFP
ncbi:MAG: hypothetical protein ABI647_09490 [Gemmatimonadota bacterium]